MGRITRTEDNADEFEDQASETPVTSAVERVRSFIRVASREPQDGEPFTVDEDVMTDHLSDLRTILSELDRLSAALGEAREAIAVTRSLVSEGACVGFIPTEGDWANRLFANQARLTAIAPISTQQQEARDGRE